jgi:hypothetical protein
MADIGSSDVDGSPDEDDPADGFRSAEAWKMKRRKIT